MAAPVTFSGLASGLDTSSLISSLVAASKASEQPLITQQTDLQSQAGILANITSLVAAFTTYADTVSLTSDTQFRTATSSDSSVSVAVSGDAAATNHDIRVLQTANAQTTSSKTFATQGAGVLGAGSLTMTTGSGTPATVSWDSTNSLSDIAAKINGANAGCTASVLFDGTSYRLMVASTQTGIANATTFQDSGDGLDLSDPTNIKIPAADAKVMIDGVEVTRPTNVIDDALQGTTLTLNNAAPTGAADTQVAVSVDTSAAATTMNGFVSAFNAANSAINAQLAYTGTTAPATSLFGDTTLEVMQGDMMTLATSQFGKTSLDALGVTIDETGAMSLHTDTLNSALSTNPNALSDLFVGGGFAGALEQFSNTYSDPVSGLLVMKNQSMTDESNDLQSQIDQMQTNATSLQTRLESEFNALEATMSQLKSQASYVSGILNTSSTTSSSSSSSSSTSSSSG